MLPDMDHFNASCIFHVKVAVLDHLEYSKICVLTITSLGLEMQTVQRDLISHPMIF
jgi:hypothetical protein